MRSLSLQGNRTWDPASAGEGKPKPYNKEKGFGLFFLKWKLFCSELWKSLGRDNSFFFPIWFFFLCSFTTREIVWRRLSLCALNRRVMTLCSTTKAGLSVVTLDQRVLLFQIATSGLSAQPTGCINCLMWPLGVPLTWMWKMLHQTTASPCAVVTLLQLLLT